MSNDLLLAGYYPAFAVHFSEWGVWEMSVCCINMITWQVIQQTQGIAPVLFHWSTVYDADPTLKQHWINVSYLLG